MTALAAVFGGLVAGVAGTVSMDTVRYVAYRRAGGRDSPLAWEFPSVDSWEKAPAPGLAGKRLIEGRHQHIIRIDRHDGKALAEEPVRHIRPPKKSAAAFGCAS